MRRYLAILLSAAMMAALTVGCGTKEDNKDAQQQSTEKTEECTLTYWYTYGDAEEEILLNTVIPMWEKEHPEITIECVRQDSSQYDEMIVTAFGTGQGPDIARIDINSTAAYAKLGGTLALSSYDDFGEISSDFMAAPLSTNFYQGEYYGLPLDTNCKAAVMNTVILKEELGLEEIPETMEELIAAAQDRGDYSISVSGFGDWDMYPYFWMFGGTLTDDEYTKASGYLDSAESVAAINKIKELHDAKIFTIRDLDGTADAWDGIESQYAMFLEGPWYNFADKEAEGIVAAPIPSYEGRSISVVGGENIVVLSTSTHPDEAYEFAKFMTSKEVQLAMLDAGQIPVLNSLSEDEKVKENEIYKVYMEQLKTAQARIPSADHTDIETIWSNTMTNIFLNGNDVETELKSAALQMDEVLAE